MHDFSDAAVPVAIHPSSEIGEGVTFGPGAVVGPNCRIGDRTRLGSNVIIVQDTTIGADNEFHAGAVIGGDPQDRAYDENVDRGELIIGDRNVVREFVTIHRGAGEGGPTRVGSDGYFMANAHIGHNSIVGDHVTMTNCSVLGGHVRVGESAVLSAYSGVHQFCEIGEYALLQASAIVSQHVPPYCLVHRGGNQLSGINAVGLRRSGKFTRQEISDVREAYRLIFRSSSVPSTALRRVSAREWSTCARRLIEFIEHSMSIKGRRARGICTGAARSIRAGRPADDLV